MEHESGFGKLPLYEPGRSAARQPRTKPCDIAKVIANPRKLWGDSERGRFEIIPSVASRTSKSVPLRVHGGCRAMNWRCHDGKGLRREWKRLHDLADPANPGTASHQTEGDISADGGRTLEIGESSPTKNCRRVG